MTSSLEVPKLTVTQKKRIAKLVAALLSGEYKQARGHLRKEDKFCCLGVACDIYRKTAKEGKWEQDVDGVWRFLGEYSTLPEVVYEWFGFGTDDPPIGADRDGESISASVYNDGNDSNDGNNSDHIGKRSFKQIANLFEKRYLGEENK